MKVLIDLLRWGEGGTQTYAKRIIPRLMEELPESVLLAQPHVAHAILLREDLIKRVVYAPHFVTNPYMRYLFQRERLPRILVDHEIDVYFVPGETSGLRRHSVPRVRVVRMFRNMLPIDDVERRRFSVFHDLGTRIRLELLRRQVQGSLAAADRVIFTSRYSHDEIAKRVAIADHRIVYHAVPTLASTFGEAAGISAQFGRSVLYVSPTDPYKRQLEMIAGFVHYRQLFDDKLAHLTLAGPIRGRYGRQTRRAALEAGDSVGVLGPRPQAELLELMQRSDVLLFGSTCECCPNVVLEYLAVGRPIVCSNTPPMPEVAGDAAVYFTPGDPNSLANALHRVLSDSAVSSALISTARARCRRFPLSATVAGTIDALTVW